MNLVASSVRFFTLIFLIVLGGCATVAELRQPLLNKATATTSYSDMVFEQSLGADSTALELAESSPAFVFPEGKSYFKAFSIPQNEKHRHLEFQSPQYDVDMIKRESKVMIPRFAFLDENKALLGALTASTIRDKPDFWRGLLFTGRVAIPPNAKFVIVYAAETTEKPIRHPAQDVALRQMFLAPVGKTDLSISIQIMATVEDTGEAESGSKAQLFVMAEIDGKSIRNSIVDSQRNNSGRGFSLSTTLTAREIPAQRMKVKLIGTHLTGAPIQSIFSQISGSFYRVEGVVDFDPVPNKRYIVKGELGKNSSFVWIADADTGQPVTEKVGPQ
jgi:Maltose operon periplasmic protein precursor (MalM)